MRILDKNRKSYTKKYSDKEKCIFCMGDNALECKTLAGRKWKVFANKYPYMDGNVMIIPNRHVEKIEDINAEEWQEFGVVLSRTQDILKKVFEVDSFNVGINVGPQSGASISHLHWQVVPRKFKNVTVMNTFADLYLVSVAPEETRRRIDECS